MSLFLLAISRIRYWTGGLDLRYFMPMVIIGVPWMALGLEYVIASAQRLFQGGKLSPPALHVFAGGLIAAAVTCSLLDGPMSAAANMRKHAAMGLWIRDRYGPEPAVAGNLDHLTIDTFYANGRVVGTFWPRDCLKVPMPAALTAQMPMSLCSGTKKTSSAANTWPSSSSGSPVIAGIDASMPSNCRRERTN